MNRDARSVAEYSPRLTSEFAIRRLSPVERDFAQEGAHQEVFSLLLGQVECALCGFNGLRKLTVFGVSRRQRPMQNRVDAAGEFQCAFRQLDRASSVAERGVGRSGEDPGQVALRISVIRV